MLGQVVNNYEIARLLGEGGMGAVYLAEHPFLKRKAAIKILKPQWAGNRDLVLRFLNEARAANAIQHPNIIDIIDAGILSDGVPYMMMEYLQGESLADRIHKKARLRIDESLRIAGQIASALAAAHAARIIHRDLKPDNIFLTPNAQNPEQERVKVLDFGIAKLRPELALNTPHTAAGEIMGTPAYMSPEQCKGMTGDEIDHRSDIYALGVILYEMLCGRTPFEGPSFGDYFVQHITLPPPAPRSLNPEISTEIERLILKTLEKEAKNRVPTMHAMIQAMADEPDHAPGASKSARYPQPPTVIESFRQVNGEPGPEEEQDGQRPEDRRVQGPRSPLTPASRGTTLSSMAGQLRAPAWRSSRRFRRQALSIAGGSLVLLVLVTIVGLRYWGSDSPPAPAQVRPKAATISSPAAPPLAAPSTLPAPAFLPLPQPVPPPARDPMDVGDESPLASPPATRVETGPPRRGTQHSPATKRAKVRGENRSPTTVAEPPEPASKATPAGQTGNVPAAPPVSPPPKEAEPPQKRIIKREKF